MNILLTGGTGYIASHTAALLVQAGHDCVLYDNLANSHAEVANRLAQITGKKTPLVIADVRDTDQLKETLRLHSIDAVIHFAGYKAVGESVEKPMLYYSNNVAGSISLIEAMRSEGVKTLVFSSSTTVYGEPTSLPIKENHPLGAVNPYGRSKLFTEEILADLTQSDRDFRVACLRYFNPVGAHPSSLIGEEPKGAPKNLMPAIAQVAAGLQPRVQVWGGDYPTPDGTGIRDYIHIMDLAEGHAAAVNFLRHTAGWHAINLGTGRGFSVLEVIKQFEEVSGREVPYTISPRRPGDVAANYADASQAKALLNWQTRKTLKDMCLDAWNFQKRLGLKF